jgi:hypothetical protein
LTLHRHTAATSERHRQGHRDPYTAPLTRHPAAADRQTAPYPGRPRSPRRSPAPTPPPGLRRLHLIVSPDTILRWHRDLMRRRHAEASRRKHPGRPPTRHAIQALVLRLARENSSLGLPAHPRRTHHPRHQDRPLHGMGDPQDPRDRTRTRTRPPDLGHLPPQPSPSNPGQRLLHRDHAQQSHHLCLRRHRTRHPPRPRPRCHRAPHRGVDHPNRPESDHGPPRCRRHGQIPDQGP